MAKKEEEKKEDEESEQKGEGEGEKTEEGGHVAAPKANKKMKLIIIAVVALLIIGGAAGFFLTMGKPVKPATSPAKTTATDSKSSSTPDEKIVYVDLDEFIVNLEQNAGQPSFLKMGITLEVPDQNVAERIKLKMPIIRDTFQIYLRELRAEDLQGSAGIFRLREELMLRLAKIMYPDKVIDILFKEILVQ